MAVFRVTTFFGQANMGWSETWWRTAGSLTEMAVPVSQMIDFRNTLLTDIHFILACRIAVEGNNRLSRTFLPGQTEIVPKVNVAVPGTGDYELTNAQEPFDQVRACLQVETIKAGQRIGIRYLDGIPDITSKTEAATYDPAKPAKWWTHFRNWSDHMAQNGWQIKTLDKSGGNPEQKIRRYILQQAGPALLGVQIAIAPGIAVDIGDSVLLRGVKMRADGIQSPNGSWKVESTVNDNVLGLQTIYLRLSEGFSIADIKELGFIRRKLPAYTTIDKINPYRMGVHKRGKPFGAPRGRSKTRTFA